ncbi:MAG: type I glutamate--ammonia ligase, partial [Candidatus Nitrosocaldus sp.]
MPYRLVDGIIEPVSYTMEEVMDIIKSQDVKYLDLQFTSLMGRFHHVTVNAKMLDVDALRQGFPKLDGSSIKGFAQIYESDMILKPDPNTFAIIPWKDQGKTARMICDVYWGYTNERLSRDPRTVAQRAEGMLKEEGFKVSYWGPEVEFFVFNKVAWEAMVPSRGISYSIESVEAPWSNDSSNTLRLKEGYMPAEPYDTLTHLRNQCMQVLNDYFGIPCEAHHHEVATAGQCEIDMRYDTLTNAADNTMTYKYVVKNIARLNNLIATMMPKPLAMDNGSGMHVNVSLWNDKNEFYDADDEYAELSQIGRYFAGGILEHAESLCAIVAPTTNSYRRLVPGYEAPVYIAWSKGNRSAIIRVPVYFRGSKQAASKRIEFRAADPSCNPYLCFSAILAAGLDGIRKKRDAGEPVDENIYLMSAEKRRALGIKQVPPTLIDAVNSLKSDNLYLKSVFTQDLIDKLIELESRDYMEIKLRPHPHEFYL